MAGVSPPAAVPHEEVGTRHGLDRMLSEVPYHALLLSAYPVLLLYSDNVVDVPPADVAGPLAVVLGVAALLLAVFAVLLKSWPRAGLIVVAVVMPFLFAGLVVDSFEDSWPDVFLVRLHLIVIVGWVAIAASGIYVALKLGARLATATRLLNIVSVVLIALPLVPLTEDLRTSGTERNRERAVTVSSNVQSETDLRDVYHLVFDRYGSDASFESGPGIDNSEFTAWLRARGFQVVGDARANFERTVLSLAAVHDMSLHGDLMEAGDAHYDDLVERIRTSRAASIFKDAGYDYLVTGSYWVPSAYSPIADHTIKPRYEVSFGSVLADRSLLTSLEALHAMVTSGSMYGSLGQRAASTHEQFELVRALAGLSGPKLVFAHFLVPHEPYVFMADGSVDVNNASHETQLAYTNHRLQRVIETLLDVPEADQPIIIVQADEGPYPERYDEDRDDFDWTTATADELVTKFGVLNAFHLPGPAGEAALPSGLSLVNTYPEIMRRYLGLDVENVPDRVFAMVDGNRFDVFEITGDVEAAFEELLPG